MRAELWSLQNLQFLSAGGAESEGFRFLSGCVGINSGVFLEDDALFLFDAAVLDDVSVGRSD